MIGTYIKRRPITSNAALALIILLLLYAWPYPTIEGIVKPKMINMDMEVLEFLFRDVIPGGSFIKDSCNTDMEQTAIIIPCRDREHHLRILLLNLIPFLRKQKGDFTLFVAETAGPGTFNKGLLLNAAFVEVSKLGNYSCFIFQDVDMIPLNDNNLYRCDDTNPTHFVSGIDKWGYMLTNRGSFVMGGVVSFTPKQFRKINGASNLYFGWGGEDTDLTIRVLAKEMIPIRKTSPTGLYSMIRHYRDRGNAENPYRFTLNNMAEKRQDVEGLPTARYTVKSVKTLPLYTHIMIHIDVKDVLATAPGYMGDFIKSYELLWSVW